TCRYSAGKTIWAGRLGTFPCLIRAGCVPAVEGDASRHFVQEPQSPAGVRTGLLAGPNRFPESSSSAAAGLEKSPRSPSSRRQPKGTWQLLKSSGNPRGGSLG